MTRKAVEERVRRHREALAAQEAKVLVLSSVQPPQLLLKQAPSGSGQTTVHEPTADANASSTDDQPPFTPVEPSFRSLLPSVTEATFDTSELACARSMQWRNGFKMQLPEFLPACCVRQVPHNAAVVLEMPLHLSAQPMPSVATDPCVRGLKCTVFLKHWNFNYRVTWKGPWATSCFEDDMPALPHDEQLLTIGVITNNLSGERTFATAELQLDGPHLPVTICTLAVFGFLSLHWTASRNKLQFVLHDIPLTYAVRTSMMDFLGWLKNQQDFDALMPSPQYDRDWIYDTVRRRLSDQDNAQWLPYMKRVQNVDALHVTLRPYQQRAVAWMLYRELDDAVKLFDEQTVYMEAERLGPMFVLSYSDVRIVSKFAFHPASLRLWFGDDVTHRGETKLGPGGWLCDEMGLGKTVELMQLVLCNQSARSCEDNIFLPKDQDSSHTQQACAMCDRAASGSFTNCIECRRPIHSQCTSGLSGDRHNNFLCQKCAAHMAELSRESMPMSMLAESKATLVVVPAPLLLQWSDEIKKHVKSALNVVTFEGLKKSGYIPQRDLLNADVVIATYDALRSDVATVQSLRRPRVNMRHAKQYYPTPVPLLTIRWHRLALDESQMLGSSQNSAALRMAGFLHARYRWCVTGTPVSDDLRGSTAMLTILQATTGEKIDWDELCRPSCFVAERKWVATTLRRIMWRTVKADIEESELNLPPQIIEVVRTSFGAIELFHYRSLQTEVAALRTNIREGRHGVSDEVSNELLTMLRQACCHPRIGSSGRRLMIANVSGRLSVQLRRVRGENAIARATKAAEEPLDMHVVLDALISKTQGHCQDALRSCIAAFNGLAGLGLVEYSLKPAHCSGIEGLVTAIRMYREALLTANDVKNLVRMDDIQRMHILFNMSDAFKKVEAERQKTNAQDNNRRHLALVELGRTIQESEAEEQFNNLRRRYLKEAETRLQVATHKHGRINEQLGDEPLIQQALQGNGSDFDDEGIVANDSNGEGDLLDDSNAEESGENDCEDDIDASGDVDEYEADHTGSYCGRKAGADVAVSNGSHEIAENGNNEANVSASHAINSKRKKRTRQRMWWEETMARLMENGEDEQFLDSVTEEFREHTRGSGQTTLASRLHCFMSISTVIEGELRNMQEARIELNTALQDLPGGRVPTDDEVMQSGLCSACREGGSGEACAHCTAEPFIKNVEQQLYSVIETPGDVNNEVQTNENMLSDSMRPGRRANSRTPGMLKVAPRVPRSDGLKMKSQLEKLLELLEGSLRKMRSDASRKLEHLSQELEEDKFTSFRAELKRLDRFQKSSKEWMKKLKNIKQELAAAKVVFEAQRALLGSMDEVKMAQTRLTVLSCARDKNQLSHMGRRQCLIPKTNVPSLKRQFMGDKNVALADLKNKRGSLSYLFSLRTDRDASNMGSKRARPVESEKCAICFSGLEEDGRIGIFSCAHMFCRECTMLLVNDGRRQNNIPSHRENALCPTCRRPCRIADISFTLWGPSRVDKAPRCDNDKRQINHGDATGDDGKRNAGIQPDKQAVASGTESDSADAETEIQAANTSPPDETVDSVVVEEEERAELASTFYDATEPVIGSIGCKPGAIVRLLRGIWRQDDESKVVIFSEWTEALELIRKALRMNRIIAFDGSITSSPRRFADLIKSFKEGGSSSVLLLPLRRAGAGLNLVEATHVVLVEPSVDIALERQAIGRVHRIGQTKVTYVHRVITSNSVEDRILRLGDRCRSGTRGDSVAADARITVSDVIAGFNGIVGETPSFPVDGESSDDSSAG